MLKTEILAICKTAAKSYGIDPLLIMAVCEQESQDQKEKGSCDEYAVRLENGFYNRYIKRFEFATSSEVLLSASYGLMQVMGESLREMKYFEWYRKWYNGQHPTWPLLTEELSQLTVVKGIDDFMINPIWQIEWGIKWFDRKLKGASGNVETALQRWNGGGNPNYAKEVMSKFDRMKSS